MALIVKDVLSPVENEEEISGYNHIYIPNCNFKCNISFYRPTDDPC
jgi:hypothetical protein